MRLLSWLRNRASIRPPQARAQHRPAAPRLRPRLEALEDRALLSTYNAATASDLIADVNAANKHGGSNTIVLTAPTTSPYVLTAVSNTTTAAQKDGPTGLPVIKKGDSLTIVGNGDTIERSTASGTPAFRLFDVANGGSLTLENLTLQNGLEQYGSGPSSEGGAIYNQGTLVLSQVTIQNNTAAGWNPAGGGIWSNGSLTLENSTVEANVAANDFGGPAYGGGIYIAGGTATITGSAFGNPNGLGGNTAEGSTAYGGAVYVAGGTVTLSGDSLGTVGPTFGEPGNYALGGYSSSTLGDGYGGGLYVAGGTVTLRNDYVQGNQVADLNNSDGVYYGDYGGYGGGIYIASGATVYLDLFTAAYTSGNSANPPADIYGPYQLLAPLIDSFTASPDPVTAGSSLTLTASNITDGNANSTVTQVSFFYYDSSGTQHVLGYGTQTSPGVWTLSSTNGFGLSAGTYLLHAQAEDSYGISGYAAWLWLTVQ